MHCIYRKVSLIDFVDLMNEIRNNDRTIKYWLKMAIIDFTSRQIMVEVPAVSSYYFQGFPSY